jgi:hypothetical protein
MYPFLVLADDTEITHSEISLCFYCGMEIRYRYERPKEYS